MEILSESVFCGKSRPQKNSIFGNSKTPWLRKFSVACSGLVAGLQLAKTESLFQTSSKQNARSREGENKRDDFHGRGSGMVLRHCSGAGLGLLKDTVLFWLPQGNWHAKPGGCGKHRRRASPQK